MCINVPGALTALYTAQSSGLLLRHRQQHTAWGKQEGESRPAASFVWPRLSDRQYQHAGKFYPRGRLQAPCALHAAAVQAVMAYDQNACRALPPVFICPVAVQDRQGLPAQLLLRCHMPATKCSVC